MSTAFFIDFLIHFGIAAIVLACVYYFMKWF